MAANTSLGYEPARLAFKVRHLQLKPPDAYDDWRWSSLQMMRLKKIQDEAQAGDPAHPLTEMKQALDAAYTFADLEACLPAQLCLQLQVGVRSILAEALQETSSPDQRRDRPAARLAEDEGDHLEREEQEEQVIEDDILIDNDQDDPWVGLMEAIELTPMIDRTSPVEQQSAQMDDVLLGETNQVQHNNTFEGTTQPWDFEEVTHDTEDIDWFGPGVENYDADPLMPDLISDNDSDLDANELRDDEKMFDLLDDDTVDQQPTPYNIFFHENEKECDNDTQGCASGLDTDDDECADDEEDNDSKCEGRIGAYLQQQRSMLPLSYRNV
eukprot:g49573.t1